MNKKYASGLAGIIRNMKVQLACTDMSEDSVHGRLEDWLLLQSELGHLRRHVSTCYHQVTGVVLLKSLSDSIPERVTVNGRIYRLVLEG